MAPAGIMRRLPIAVLVCLILGETASANRPLAADASFAGSQIAFRVRADAEAPLNGNDGWAGDTNANVTIDADRPFRIRFALAIPDKAKDRRFSLQYRRNDGEWTEAMAEDFPKSKSRSPRVSIVAVKQYAHGTATVGLLADAASGRKGGTGISKQATTPAWSRDSGEAEWEWPLVIRRFADGPEFNEAGDRFEFRMVETGGRPFESYRNPVVTLAVPPRHVGGTFVETPGRIGPFQAANGDLYFIMEPTETDNRFMVVKSGDHGKTWREVDGGNRPRADDLESVDARLVGSTIHMLHQTSFEVWYHAFRTSDDPKQPDTWQVRDEVAAKMGEPPSQVVTLAVRSDGSIVGVYGGPLKVHLRIRSPQGGWGTETVVDSETGPNLSGPQAVLGAGNVVHLAYTGADGTAWYRRVLPDGTLTPRVQIASGLGTKETDVGSILPLAYVPSTDTVSVIYRLASGQLFERRVGPEQAPSPAVKVTDRNVAQCVVDSDQPAADVIVNGTTRHVLFVEEKTGSIYSTESGDDGNWLPSRLAVDRIRGSWVRGALLTRPDGTRVYGFVYDAGSNGGSGLNRYDEAALQPAKR